MNKVDCSIIPTTISYSNFNSFFKTGLVITGLALCIIGILAVCVGDAFGAINASWYYFELAGLACFAAFCVNCCCCKKRSASIHSQNQVQDSKPPQQKTRPSTSAPSSLLDAKSQAHKIDELLEGIISSEERLQEELRQKYQKIAEEDLALKSLLETALEALNQNNIDEAIGLLEETKDEPILKIVSNYKRDTISSAGSKMNVLKRMVGLRINTLTNKIEIQKTLLG